MRNVFCCLLLPLFCLSAVVFVVATSDVGYAGGSFCAREGHDFQAVTK